MDRGLEIAVLIPQTIMDHVANLNDIDFATQCLIGLFCVENVVIAFVEYSNVRVQHYYL